MCGAEEGHIVVHRTANIFKPNEAAFQRAVDFAHSIKQTIEAFPDESALRRNGVVVL
jgi:hypothetical protein